MMNNEFPSTDGKTDDPEGMTEILPVPSSILAIDKSSVHRICSGQVVLTLAVAVKELVENSIDAGATSVDVKLKEYGSDTIEVSDNGCGVEEKNFSGLTLKHHTSKIADFADVAAVETFGFRGEALSSLCALSNLCVVTCDKSASVGTKLEFNQQGNITCKSPCPRQTGTTVVLQNLFYTLPVRHKEFQRNLKKEFAKMVQLLNAYCLITTGARITCSNQVGKGNRSVVVSTKGNASIKENIANIFGPKQVQSLLEFKQTGATEEVCSWFGIKNRNNCEQTFGIEGFVSKCEHGQGRSSTDRQFVFINKRPCDSSKMIRLINEVYHSYNRHQNPFVLLHITMAKESVDVNVTPDKRQIFMAEEKLLLATLKSSLVKMYEPTTSFLRINQVESSVKHGEDLSVRESQVRKPTSSSELQQTSTKQSVGVLSRLKRAYSSAFAKEDSTSSTEASKERKTESCVLPKRHSLPTTVEPKQESSIKMFFMSASQKHSPSQNLPSSSITASLSNHLTNSSPCELTGLSSGSLDDGKCVEDKSGHSLDDGKCVDDKSTSSSSQTSGFGSVSSNTNCRLSQDVTGDVSVDIVSSCGFSKTNSNLATDSCHGDISDGIVSSSGSMSSNTIHNLETDSSHGDVSDETVSSILSHEALEINDVSETGINDVSSSVMSYSDTASDKNESLICKTSHTGLTSRAGSVFHSNSGGDDLIDSSVSNKYSSGEHCEQVLSYGRIGSESCDESVKEQQESSQLDNTQSTQSLQYDEKLCSVKKEKKITFSLENLKRRKQKVDTDSRSEFCRSFRAQIVTNDNKAAENELQKEITKDMFHDMDVLGQFNLGFIISKLGDDLFIVDQHASDEKYNFEMLQRQTVINSQKLICPLNLELTASNEAILVDNLEIFKKNGFDFIIDESAEPSQRIKLLSTPVSKNWNFGKEDIEELVFMLTESPGVMCRPSRIRQMFASRACRKSIMIGTALKQSEMKKLLCHMGEIDQPWNCPHGRPTMRHLINMNMLPS